VSRPSFTVRFTVWFHPENWLLRVPDLVPDASYSRFVPFSRAGYSAPGGAKFVGRSILIQCTASLGRSSCILRTSLSQVSLLCLGGPIWCDVYILFSGALGGFSSLQTVCSVGFDKFWVLP
jgi:hypothetical protein